MHIWAIFSLSALWVAMGWRELLWTREAPPRLMRHSLATWETETLPLTRIRGIFISCAWFISLPSYHSATMVNECLRGILPAMESLRLYVVYFFLLKYDFIEISKTLCSTMYILFHYALNTYKFYFVDLVV